MSWDYTQQDNDSAWQRAQMEEAEKAAMEDQEQQFIKAMQKIAELRYLREVKNG